MSTNTERITNLESEVELLKQKLNDSISFINTLRVMYEMKHPVEEEPKSTAVSLASTIVDEEEPSLELTFDEEQVVSLASTIVDEEEPSLELTFDEEQVVSLAPTIVDEEQVVSLAPTIVDEEQVVSLAPTIVDEEVLLDQKFEKMNQIYDDLDLLSDNEEYEENEETSELILIDEDNEELSEDSSIPIPPPPTPVVQQVAPLPSNLSTSPMPEFIEVVEEVINYKKTKVSELKKLCKTRGFKGYSKLKKQQLIDLLTQ